MNYKRENLCQLYTDCVEYINNCEDGKEEYLKELATCDTWEKFINSGIFHDAIGKVTDYSETEVSVITDY